MLRVGSGELGIAHLSHLSKSMVSFNHVQAAWQIAHTIPPFSLAFNSILMTGPGALADRLGYAMTISPPPV